MQLIIFTTEKKMENSKPVAKDWNQWQVPMSLILIEEVAAIVLRTERLSVLRVLLIGFYIKSDARHPV